MASVLDKSLDAIIQEKKQDKGPKNRQERRGRSFETKFFFSPLFSLVCLLFFLFLLFIKGQFGQEEGEEIEDFVFSLMESQREEIDRFFFFFFTEYYHFSHHSPTLFSLFFSLFFSFLFYISLELQKRSSSWKPRRCLGTRFIQ